MEVLPPPRIVGNALGFIGGSAPRCCILPCIQFPPCTVNICLTINAATEVTIEQGCRAPSADDDDSGESTDTIGACRLKFAEGTTQNTWGKRCRKVTWSRQVPYGSYVRIRLCASNVCLEDGMCIGGSGSGAGTDSAPLPKNALGKLVINGRDIVQDIATIAQSKGGLEPGSCIIKAACIGAPSAGAPPRDGPCCQWFTTDEHTIVSWGDGTASDLPLNTEIVVGPIGDPLAFAPVM